MNKQRVAKLIEAYGSDSDNWPTCERAAASVLSAKSADLQAMQRSAAELDVLLRQDMQATQLSQQQLQLLSERIMAGLASRRTSPQTVHIHRWRQMLYWLQRPVYASVLAGLLLVLVWVNWQTQVTDERANAADKDFDAWMFAEYIGDTTLESAAPAADFLGLLDLEI
jgi:hypothetical protein